ncbi:MAG: Rpp14/Pop5 family protein [Candidatus Kariarchaeaceae archaeon]|jgi:RNase P/RNase MRP subunit POP5
MVVKLDRVRYLKIEFFNDPPSIGQFVSSIRNSVKTIMGEIFLANSSLHVVEYAETFAIIRCTHTSRDAIEAAIQMTNFEEFVPVVRKVSGTLKSLSKNAIDTELENDENID